MVDLIDRSMAIDAVSDGILREEEEPLVECVAECNSMIEWAVETLKKLPSAEQLTDNGIDGDNCDKCIFKCRGITSISSRTISIPYHGGEIATERGTQ